MKGDFKCVLAYYGGKALMAHHYPAPRYPAIIEPFCGGASYSLKYYWKDVTLNDLWKPVVQAWQFLLSSDALRIVKDRIPHSVEAGAPIETLVREDDPIGLVRVIQSQCALGAFGMGKPRPRVAKFAANRWGNFRDRLEWFIPRIAHWQVTEQDYQTLPNPEATWFIDPPYANPAGSKYNVSAIDYAHLATWCQTRAGDAIVSENVGATWLPFEILTTHRTTGFSCGTGAKTTGEAIWTQYSKDEVGLFAA
jgi:hypothetical protein